MTTAIKDRSASYFIGIPLPFLSFHHNASPARQNCSLNPMNIHILFLSLFDTVFTFTRFANNLEYFSNML